jgi:putative heme-binding domain-containing protein
MKKLTSADLVKALENKNDWYPRHARRILQERGPNSDLHPALDKLAFEHPDDTRRLRGLWAFSAIGGLDDARIARALKDESPYVRGWAIQLATEEGILSEALADQLVALAGNDPSPVVRLYLASAAPKLSATKRFEVLKELIAHPEDENDHNLPLMYWYAVEPLTQDPSVDVIALLQSAKIPLVRDFLARRLAQQDNGRFLPQLISATLSSPANAEVASAVIREILEGLRGERKVKMPATWPAAYRALASSTDPQLVRLATQLAIKFADPQAIELQRKTLVNSNAPSEIRRDALASLVSARVPELAPVLQSLVGHPDLAGAAIRALGGYEDANTPTVLIESYSKLTFNDKRDALNTLASRPAYANALLDAVEQNRIARSDLAADLVRQLRTNKDSKVVERVAAVIGTVRNTPRDKQKQIANLKVLLTSRPSPENAPDTSLGRAVFAKTCQQCHTLFGEGKKIGPDLTGSNRANLDYVLSNVVDPSALVGKDYQAHIIQTDDGRQFVGIVTELPGGALQVSTANGVEVVPQEEIEARKVSESSMMPDDILRPLSEREIRSLVAYLATPAQVPLPPSDQKTAEKKVTFRRTQLDDKFRSEGVSVGDFNRDGKKDIAAGPVWFAAPDWKLSEIQKEKTQFDPRHYSQSFVNVSADLNGDGWDDLIVVDFPGQQTWWFENPGESTGPWNKHMIARVSNNESPHVVDIDGNKKFALVMGVAPDPAKPDDERQMAILRPSASPTDPWKIQTISGLNASGAKHFSHGLGVGDINGDGRQDVVVADGWYESPVSADTKEWKFHLIKFGKPVSHMVVYDFDGDGDADIACASAHQTGIWWLEQLSDGWKAHEIDASYSETHSLCLADINADGLPDLVTGKRWWSHAPKDGSEGPPSFVKWYELQRESGRPVWTSHQIDDSSGVGTQFEVADVNGDGLLDVVTSNKKGTFYFEQVASEPAAK